MKINFTSQNIPYLALFFVAPLFLLSILNQSRNLRSSALKTNTPIKLSIVDSIIPTPALLPVKIKDEPIQLSAKAISVIDLDSMSILFDQNTNTVLPLASTTKIMTALLAIEHYSLTDWLTVNGVKTDGSNIGLSSGDRYQVTELLGALLVGSANDAAEVLASNFPGGMTGFIWGMNQKALELGMKNTHFTNPIGYDHPDHYSTARDLAILTAKAIQQPLIAHYVSQKSITIHDETNTKTLQARTTNELLNQDTSILGVKTGWTENAGECLIAYVKRNNHPIITVVLGSSNRFEETKTLAKWVYDSYAWQDVTAQPIHL